VPNDVTKTKSAFTRYPVVSLGAEYLVMGYLMRRNILAYKAPPNNEGYDIICIHPEPRRVTRQIRIQVKSRLATDHDGGFPVKEKTFAAFDYVVIAYLNVGYFFSKQKRHGTLAGAKEPDFYTLPVDFINKHHDTSSSWHKVRLRGVDISAYRNELGFEQVARELEIPYPEKLPKVALGS